MISNRDSLTKRSVICGFLWVCFICSMVSAGDFESPSWRGFDQAGSAIGHDSGLSLLTLFKESSAEQHSAATVTCKSGDICISISFADGYVFPANAGLSLEAILPTDLLWTWGRYNIPESVNHTSAQAVALIR